MFLSNPGPLVFSVFSTLSNVKIQSNLLSRETLLLLTLFVTPPLPHLMCLWTLFSPGPCSFVSTIHLQTVPVPYFLPVTPTIPFSFPILPTVFKLKLPFPQTRCIPE